MLKAAQIAKIKTPLSQQEGDNVLVHAFDALSDPGRFRIFKLLIDHNDICVTDVAHLCGISVPAASRQLKILEMTGLVARQRTGKTICYKIIKQNPVVRSIIRLLINNLKVE